MDQTYYLAANGQEYRTLDDAENYGGGVTAKRVVTKAVYQSMSADDIATEASSAPIPSNNLENLQNRAQALGVKGWALMKESTLEKKIASAKDVITE